MLFVAPARAHPHSAGTSLIPPGWLRFSSTPENTSSRLPLYAQVEDALVSRISSGALPAGTQLPSEEELVREFDVSRTTIRTTIQNLVRQGLV